METLQMHRWIFVAPNESESVKCSPSPISNPINFALQNPSRAFGLIGKEKHRLHAPIVPKCKPIKSQIKGRSHRSSLKRRDCLPYLCLIPQLSKSMVQPHCCRLTWTEINGIAACRRVGAAELHEILFIPYDVHLHFLLFTCFFWKILSYLNQIHPNSKRSATYENGKTCGSHTSFSVSSRLNSLCWLQSWNGLR